MELWELNVYLEGKNEEYKNRQKEIISQAWHTACFVWSEELKGLDYYLEERKPQTNEEHNEKIEFAKEMSRKIEGR